MNGVEENMQAFMPTLNGMAIAANNIGQMVIFYNKVFNANLFSFSLGNSTFYQGKIGGLNITLAPNEMVGIQAEKSLYQLSFIVPNIEKAVELARRSGGTQMQQIAIDHTEKYCGITDPDGNSIELIEPLSLSEWQE
jgi:predicted enzyme related to lactoylglutathione lyase